MSIILKITPIGKPRMVKSDIWSGRKAVADYWLFKDLLNIEARKKRYKLGYVIPLIIFYLPMPDSWSKKKKLSMNGKPHQQKPDGDNLLKAFQDCLLGDDSRIWDARFMKLWSIRGYIEVFNKTEASTRQ